MLVYYALFVLPNQAEPFESAANVQIYPFPAGLQQADQQPSFSARMGMPDETEDDLS